MKRVGMLYISREFYESVDVVNASNILSRIGFVPYRVEYLFYKNCFELIGESSNFRYVNDGCQPPEYRIIIDIDEMKILKVSVEEVV